MNRIDFSADLASDLDWEFPLKEETFWHLDFGWDKTPLDLYNPAHFNSYLLAVEEFCKKVPECAKKIIFTISNGSFSNLLLPSEQFETSYLEYLSEHKMDPSPFHYTLFCANLFSEYLHRLASVLPEEKEPYLLFEISDNQELAEMILLLSRRRFEHFHLLFSDCQIPIQKNQEMMGVSLPQDAQYIPSAFKTLFASLQKKNFPYTCIPEEFLNEHWEGLESLIVYSDKISDIGMRMLYGFEAAGGQIISIGKNLGFSNEISYEAFEQGAKIPFSTPFRSE